MLHATQIDRMNSANAEKPRKPQAPHAKFTDAPLRQTPSQSSGKPARPMHGETCDAGAIVVTEG
jgi:hypothetical protein